ncbi:MAG: hypothetical protein Q7S19_00390 [bacterium]|nr:hypothetical protein [bacterium]
MKIICYKRGFAPVIIISFVTVFLIASGYLYSNHGVKEIKKLDTDKPVVKVATESEKESEKEVPRQDIGVAELPKVAPINQTPQDSGNKKEVRVEDIVNWVNHGFSNKPEDLIKKRLGWEILSDEERALLPDCENVLMKTSPVPLDSIVGIEPIGSANPPEHTLASISSDTYIAVNGQGTTQTTPLVAPGDMWIILITPRYGATQDPEDHTIKYAFCKDVFGVVDHIKGFSPVLKKIVDEYKCPNSSDSPGSNNCPVMVLNKIVEGTPLGTVGRMQGNFNFGTWDLRVTHSFISPSRHGFLTKHSTCPYNYFSSPLREQLLAKLEPTAKGNCGTVEHDITGTLQGDWFIGNASPMRPADWGKLLHFGLNNRFSGESVISTSGMFVSQPTKWIFTANSLGNINRKFNEVVPGSTYCYDNDGNHQYRNNERGITSGRIIVQLTSASELQIEHQDGSCSVGNWEFKNSTHYQR